MVGLCIHSTLNFAGCRKVCYILAREEHLHAAHLGQMILKDRFRAALREPLVQFLVGGFVVFLFFMVRGNDVDPASRMISIDALQVERLTAGWTQTWRRPPSQVEIDGLIRDYIKEEIYYREAKRLGLDDDDAVIRRRLRSKMEFLASAEAENSTSDDATLQAWLDRYPAKYVADVRLSFDQIYLIAKDENAALVRAQKLLVVLNNGADKETLGDDISLPRSLEKADMSSVKREFGDEFAASLAGIKPGPWAGPIASGFGLHLIRVRAVEAPAKPQLGQVRQAVENDWRAATLKDREAKAYQALLDGYTITIAKP